MPVVHARKLCFAAFLFCASASADTLTIDLPTAVKRARERAPDAVAARARIDEATARRTGATVPFTQRPEVQVGLGPRFGDERTLNLQAQVTQPLELGRRSARIAVADAEVAHANAQHEAELRKIGYEGAIAYCEARHADLVGELATRTRDVAARALEVAQKRRKAGELTDLDVNLASVALHRARSAVASAAADRAVAIGRLAALIGATQGDTITLSGSLEPAASAPGFSGLSSRVDLVAFEAEARVARAEGRVARAAGRPELGVWFGYQLDEGDSIALAGISFSLPVWNPARGDRAAARAKERRIVLERDVTLTVASRQIADASEALARAREAVDLFQRDVLPALDDSEALLAKSLESGQLAINAYLVARQEILDGRREYLDRLLQLAKASAAFQFVSGGQP